MTLTPFTKEELQTGIQQYETHTKGLSARTLDEASFWAEESRMLSEFPDRFQSAGCIPERKHLKCLTKWKWPGLWANHAHANTQAEIRETTQRAFTLTADTDQPPDNAIRKQLQLLDDGLAGIAPATATVLLTFWRPDTYTVMDERVLSSLAAADYWDGATEATIEDYPEYLTRCLMIAEETGLSLRNVDRGLWAIAD